MNKKLILAAGVILVFLAYVGYQKTHSSGIASTDTPVAITDNNTPMAGGTSAGSESINPNAGGTAVTGGVSTTVAGSYKDGTYTGSVADAIYGPIQVQAVISGGKITDVQFLQYPNSSGHTREISQRTMPQLKSMAIAQQNAQVNIISGATQTTEAFQQSLASALSQAKS